MIVCDKVCQFLTKSQSGETSSLSSNKSQSFLVVETLGEGIDDNLFPLGGSVLRQVRGVQRKPLPASAVFQVTSAQNNPMSKILAPFTLYHYFSRLCNVKLIKDANYASPKYPSLYGSRLKWTKIKELVQKLGMWI